MSVAAFGDLALHVTVLAPGDAAGFVPGTIDLSPGGSATVLAWQLAALGRPVRLLALMGRDPVGRLLRAELEAAGVDCEGGVPVEETPRIAITAGAPGREQVVADVPPQAPERLLAAAGAAGEDRFVYVPGFPGYEPLLERFAPTGRLVADLGFAPWLDSLAVYRDAVLRRCRGALAVLSGGRFDDAANAAIARDCLEAGARAVVTTLGERGVMVTTSEAVSVQAGRRSEAVCTIGAGDAFVAGMLSGLLGGLGLDEAVGEGQAVAAAKVERVSGPAAPEAVAEARRRFDGHSFTTVRNGE